MMKKSLNLFYIISATVFLFGIYTENQLLANISKPIPLLILLILIRWNSPYNILIGIGLVFSLAGDVLLESFKLFVPGLIAFLLAHLFYIVAFVKKSSKSALLSGLPFYAYAALMFIFLKNYLGEMVIPVGFYILVISTMLWRSYVQRNSSDYSKWAFFGAILFTLSDSLIAISKFYQSFILSSLIIMVTYWAGQYLIYLSTLMHEPKK